MVKLWHDDVRPPPDETWTWAQTNAEAQGILTKNDVEECSLDHDLGGIAQEYDDPSEVIFIRGISPNGDGHDLVLWMIENDKVPPVITIHSWNPAGAARMARSLKDAGHNPLVRPYETDQIVNWFERYDTSA